MAAEREGGYEVVRGSSDAAALYNLGYRYWNGLGSLPKNKEMA